MGWKTLKDAFGLDKFIVQVDPRGICIGSGYVHDLVVIDPATGQIQINRTFPDFLSERCPALLQATPAQLAELIATPDIFSASIPVFTYKGGDIIEQFCEVPGWPNVTHDGSVMYENTHSTDKATLIGWAKENAAATIKSLANAVQRIERELAEYQTALTTAIANEAKLNAVHPVAKEEVSRD